MCGGIAAYKAVELCRRWRDQGANVYVILTHNATRFIGVETFAALATEPPVTELWGQNPASPHTRLARLADVVVVAPATARLIGSYTHGLSDDVLATTLIATRAPVVLAPAMHTEMWEHPSVVDNIGLLRRRQVAIVEPEVGALAGGDLGVGRLASTESITRATAAALAPKATSLANRRLVVTAGGTKEPIDPVRYIGNRSSGKQGHTVAEVAAEQGAAVTLITAAAPSAPSLAGIDVVPVQTASEMAEAVMKHLSGADALVMASAVADFRPAKAHGEKLKKLGATPAIALEPTEDILMLVSQKRTSNQVVVGFAAETNDLESNAQAKMKVKQLDFIVANDVAQPGLGFDSDDNAAVILGSDGTRYATGAVSKRTVAVAIIERVAQLLATRPGGGAQ